MASEEPVWFRCGSCLAEFCIGEKVSPPDAPAHVQYCPYCGVSALHHGYQLHPTGPLRFAE